MTDLDWELIFIGVLLGIASVCAGLLIWIGLVTGQWEFIVASVAAGFIGAAIGVRR